MNCETCKYYDSQLQTCRIKPPKVNGAGNGYWPKVNPDDWCGEYRPNQDQQLKMAGVL